MKSFFQAACAAALAASCTAAAPAGQGLGYDRTRIVAGPGCAAAITASDTASHPYLVRSYIEDDSGKASGALRAVPPLGRVNPGESLRIRVVTLDAASLPADRETLLWFCSLAIPGQSGPRASAQLNINFLTRLKVFYRPAGLRGSMREAIAGLRWSCAGGRLAVRNPSAYNVTLASLSVSGRPVGDLPVLAPFSSHAFDVSAGAAPVRVAWSGVDDIGAEQRHEADASR